jgi:hypothetical protein
LSLAYTSITMTTGATILNGRALALNGAVTMDNNTISVLPVPEPSSFAALALALTTLCACRRHRQPAAG